MTVLSAGVPTLTELPNAMMKMFASAVGGFENVISSLLTGVSAGKFVSDSVGIVTNTPVGVQTSTLDDKDLTGIGNSFKGLYIGNGMVIHDSELTGTHYIGTSFRGMMAGPVSIAGTLTVDGNYVVV